MGLKRLVVRGSLFVAMCLAPTVAHGSTITFNTSDSQFDAGIDNQGWWSATEPNTDSNDTYYTGWSIFTGEIRDFFTFDLSTLDLTGQTVTGATLEVVRGNYRGTAPAYDVEFFDVSTAADTLNNNVGTSTTIFDDLGSGTSYGLFSVADYTTSDTLTLTFVLNAAALTDITAAAGKGFFSIGGRLYPLGLVDLNGQEAIFQGTSSFGIQRLILQTSPADTTVPEPASMLLVTAGLAGFAARRHFRRAR